MAEKENQTSTETLQDGGQIDLSLSLYPSGNFALVSPNMVNRSNALDSDRLPRERRFLILLDGTSGIGMEVLMHKSTGKESNLTLSSFGSQILDLVGCPKISAKHEFLPQNVLYDGSAIGTLIPEGFSFKVVASGGEGITVKGVEPNTVRFSFKKAS